MERATTQADHARATARMAACGILAAVMRPTKATFPGENGKFAFTTDRDGNEEILPTVGVAWV